MLTANPMSKNCSKFTSKNSPANIIFDYHSKRELTTMSLHASDENSSQNPSSGKHETTRIDPKYIKTFNKLFGNEINKLITKKFISDVTKSPIDDLTFVSTLEAFDINSSDQSLSYFGVLWKTPHEDRFFLIDVQTCYERDFCQRLMYNVCKIYSSEEPDYYENSRWVTSISILSHPFLIETPRYFSTHRILDTVTNACESEGLAIHLIDLTKFHLSVDQLNSNVDAWAFYFKNILSVDQSTIDDLRNKYPFMNGALDEWQKFTLNKEEYDEYILYCMRMIERTSPDSALVEDVEKISKRGLVRAAKRMLEDGMANELISKYTGLKEEEFK